MIAFSTRQPWAELIALGLKTIEVRGPGLRATVASLVGRQIAIHTGKRYEASAPVEVQQAGLAGNARARCGGIVAVATVHSLVLFEDESLWRDEADAHRNPLDWWQPELIGIRFRDVGRLPDMVPCPGKLGFWTLDREVARQVRCPHILPAGRTEVCTLGGPPVDSRCDDWGGCAVRRAAMETKGGDGDA